MTLQKHLVEYVVKVAIFSITRKNCGIKSCPVVKLLKNFPGENSNYIVFYISYFLMSSFGWLAISSGSCSMMIHWLSVNFRSLQYTV